MKSYRIIALILNFSVLLCLAFTGCGSSSSNGNTAANDDASPIIKYERNPNLLDTSQEPQVFDLYGMEIEAADEPSVRSILKDYATYFKIEHCIDSLKLSSEKEIQGEKCYRYQQYYNDFPVYGKGVIVTTSGGKMLSLINDTRVIKDAVTTADENAIYIICDSLAFDADKLIESGRVSQYLYDLNGQYTTVFVISTEDGSLIMADANTGEIIKSSSLIKEVDPVELELEGQKPEGQSDRPKQIVDATKDGDQYTLVDTKRKIYVFDSSFSDEYIGYTEKINKANLISFKDEHDCKYYSAVDALESIEKIYDFYDNVLGHKSSDGKGTATIRVYDGFHNYTTDSGQKKSNQDNAGALGRPEHGVTDIIIGPSSKGTTYSNRIDVLGHEFTHSIIHYVLEDEEAEFISKEGDALNEGLADIMGLMIEAYYDEKQECDWAIEGARDYNDVKLKQKYTEYSNIGDIHEEGTIICNVARQMWSGNSGATDIEPINNPAIMAELWYRVIMTSNIGLDYTQCRSLLELNALNMHREGKLSAEQYRCVLWSCDQAQIKYRLNSGYESGEGLTQSNSLLVKSNSYPSNTDITTVVYDHEDKVIEEYDARVLDAEKHIVMENNGVPLVINLPKGIYTIEVMEKGSDIVNYRGLIHISDFGVAERKEFLDNGMNTIVLNTELGISATSSDTDNAKKIEMHVETNTVESVGLDDNTVPAESNEEAQRLTSITSGFVTLSGTIEKVHNIEPPDKRYELNDDDWNVIRYSFEETIYEGDTQKNSAGFYFIEPAWGIKFDSPITLVLDEREITVTEMGLISNQELIENQRYILKGNIVDVYNTVYTFVFGNGDEIHFIGWEDTETKEFSKEEGESTWSLDLNNRLFTYDYKAFGGLTDEGDDGYFIEEDGHTYRTYIFETSSKQYYPFGQFKLICDDYY